jgi:hypothetical protein
MPRKSQKIAHNLSNHVERRVQSYALAATAAGAGLLALSSAAQAKVIYTPSNIPITENGGLIPLDMAKGGSADFQFSNYSYSTMGNGNFWLKVMPAQASNAVWSYQSKGHQCAAALPAGKTVGPKGKFKADPKAGIFLANEEHGSQSGTLFGPWVKVETAYLGLKFVIDGQIHYGWARIKFPAPGDWISPTLSGYAYESTPNKAIKTGQKSGSSENGGVSEWQSGIGESGTLGALARGAVTAQ